MVIVASVSCIYGIGSVESYTNMTLELARGMEIGRTQLLADLVALQYRRNDMAFARGDFRVRGDVIDLFPAHYEDRAWRIELFGDEIDSLTEFDPLTGQKSADLDRVRVYANSHYVTPRPTLKQAMVHIQDELKTRLEEFERQAAFRWKRKGWNSARCLIWKCWKPQAVAPGLRIIRAI